MNAAKRRQMRKKISNDTKQRIGGKEVGKAREGTGQGRSRRNEGTMQRKYKKGKKAKEKRRSK